MRCPPARHYSAGRRRHPNPRRSGGARDFEYRAPYDQPASGVDDRRPGAGRRNPVGVRPGARAAPRGGAAGGRAAAGAAPALPAGDGRAAHASGRRRLADGAAHLRRLGLQPARADHRRQRPAAAAGLGVLDRRQQRPRGGADRRQRRDVRVHAGAPGGGHRRRDRRPAVALQQAGARSAGRPASDHPRRRPATATRCSSPPTTPCSWRSTRGPARRCGRRRWRRTRTATT